MKLAIFGGKPTILSNQICDWPCLTNIEERLFLEKFKSLSQRNYKQDKDIHEFEGLFAKYLGAKYCLTLNSGTAAIYSSLIACELKSNENVIVPAYGFYSAAASVLNAGAKVKFCDVDLDTFNISPDDFERKIDEKTKAVIVIHNFGNPCDMKKICEISRKNKVLIIEDACQAHGAVYNNKKVGTWGDIAAFSFHIAKNLPILEGGAVVTNNVSLRDRAASTNLFPNYVKTFYPNLGYNFKFNGLFAKLGTYRLKKLDRWNQQRQKNREYLIRRLEKYSFIIPQKIMPGALSSNSLFVFRLSFNNRKVSLGLSEIRNRLLLALYKEGVPCGIWTDKIIPEMELFNLDPKNFPNAKKLADSTIYISGINYPNSKKEMKLIIKAAEKVFKNLEDLKKVKWC